MLFRSVDKIYELKNRDTSKPLILMSDKIENLTPYVKEIPQKAQELIDNYLRGDERSFEILYGRYRKLLYFHLHDFLKSDKIELDDIFQQTWLKAIDNLPKYQEQSSFGAYLKTIARNLIIDRARKKKRQGIVFEFNNDILSEIHNDKMSDMPWFELTSRAS